VTGTDQVAAVDDLAIVDVAIVGGGVVGCSAALALARRGRRVALFERQAIGWGASSRNGGIIAILGREPEQLPLIHESIRAWTDLALLPGVDFDYVRAGILWAAFDAEQQATLEAFVERERAAGVGSSRLLTRQQARTLLPALAESVVGGALGPLDGHCRSDQACATLADLARQAGAEIQLGLDVLGVERQAGRVIGLVTSAGLCQAEAVLVAAGVWAPALLEPLGRQLPIAIRRGQAYRTQPVPRLTDLALIAPQPESGHVAIRQLRSGEVTISGYRRPEFVGLNQEPTDEGISRNRAAAGRALPTLASAEESARWAGLNEQSLDNQPLIGAVPELPGLFLATGFSGHGFGIAPAVGRLLADLIATGREDPLLEPFKVDRFDHLDVPAAIERLVRLGRGGMLTIDVGSVRGA
jgi:sarcosine oxidase subunit beta